MGALTLLDAYPIVAFLIEAPAAEAADELLREGQSAVPALNLAEAIDVSCRVYGLEEEEVRQVLEPILSSGSLTVRGADEQTAWRAARLRVAYYRRRERPLSLADCFLLAAADGDDRIATADPAVAEVARLEGIELLPLPDSSGRLP